MIDWNSPAEVVKDALAFQKLVYALFGLFVWEIFQTCEFEWSLITRRRKFTWPMTFFFLCRYCMLWALIGLIISFNVTTRVNCAALYVFNSWTGNMAILCASTSLMIRTIAIWERKLVVVVPLVLLCIAHWAMLYHGIFIVHAVWDPTENECVVNSTNATFLNINFFFTMGFDLIILGFTTAALLKSASRSGLWHLLFRDGLVYWGITFCLNGVPAVLNVINLNPSMNIIATVPAATLSAIAACRAVIRLQEFSGQADYYVHSTSAITAGGNADARMTTRFGPGKPPRFALTRPEVQVTTDRITMRTFEDTRSPETPGSTHKPRTLSQISSGDEDLPYINRKTELVIEEHNESAFNAV